MNPKEVRKDLDLADAEKMFMGSKPPVDSRPDNPVDAYDKELQRIAGELGLDLTGEDLDNEPEPAEDLYEDIQSILDNIPKKTTNSRKDPRSKSRRKSSSSFSSANSGSSGSFSGSYSGSQSSSRRSSRSGSSRSGSRSGSRSSSRSGSRTSSRSGSYSDSGSGSSAGSSGSDSDVDAILAGIGADLGISWKANAKASERPRKIRWDKNSARHDARHDARRDAHRDTHGQGYTERNAGLSHLTEEQERRQHLDSVMGDLRGETNTSHGLDRIRTQDSKARKLEEIDRLIMTLEDEGINCDSVKKDLPTIDSPMEDVESALNVLKYKNDSNRYSTMAEEAILGGAEMLGAVFDGTRQIPLLGWTPNYSGYHNTVNVKLHRMRFETSQIVGNIIQRNNIGPVTRIFMELLPSFFLYPRQQSRKAGSGLHNDPAIVGRGNSRGDTRGAYAQIADSDRANDLEMLDSV